MMASSSGASSSSGSFVQNSGGSSGDDLQQIMDERKRKRMVSNRESARRSRMRKQKHMDDLIGQVGLLRKENNHILTTMNVTTQHYLNVEAENSILRAQLAELNHRLDSLNHIITFLHSSNNNNDDDNVEPYSFCNGFADLHNEVSNMVQVDDGFFSSWNYDHVLHYPQMSAVRQY